LLRRVLQNLLANAIKYTPRGKVLLGVRRQGSELTVEVCDTGPGIPKSKRAVIFKEFERLEETAASVRGLGLGLSIVERIGKVLGHQVDLRSVPGKGSIFSVRLPRAAPGVVESAPVSVPAGRIAGLTVLCIDNERSVLDGMRVMLSGWGCKVMTAQNAAEAVDRLQPGHTPPDIILADYHLDSGTGLDAVAAVRAAKRSHTPVIVISADHTPEVQREIRKHGHAFLRKPLKAAALRALMHQLTAQRPVAAE
jgi:CheY-like chemotaxis protein/anti-sigma regulatory factor (Ser/Thr protein kinase)